MCLLILYGDSQKYCIEILAFLFTWRRILGINDLMGVSGVRKTANSIQIPTFSWFKFYWKFLHANHLDLRDLSDLVNKKARISIRYFWKSPNIEEIANGLGLSEIQILKFKVMLRKIPKRAND